MLLLILKVLENPRDKNKLLYPMHNLFGLWRKTWFISIFNASTLFLRGETCERKPGLLNT